MDDDEGFRLGRGSRQTLAPKLKDWATETKMRSTKKAKKAATTI